MEKIKKEPPTKVLFSLKEVIINNYSIIIIKLQDIFCIPKRMGGRFMKLSELQELIEKFGDVKLLEIREELKKLGYSCKIVGEVDA